MPEKNKADQLKEKLFYTKKNGLATADDATVQASVDFCEDYKTFLNVAKTEREAVKEIVARAEEKG